MGVLEDIRQWLFWTLIRIIKGMLLLNDGKPISKPSSWMFG